MGDAGRTGAVRGGAIILDGYSRAYAVNLAATLSRTPVSQSLTGRLGDVSRSFSGGSGDVMVSISFRKDASSAQPRSEEHTSELQSLMRISYAVFCLKKKIIQNSDSTKHNKIN